MANVNKIILIGNVTRDPEQVNTQNGGMLCKFGLAVNRKWTTKNGDKQEEVCFFDCVAFSGFEGKRGVAGVIMEYVRKGDPLYIDGRMKMDSWEDRETGKQRSKLEVVAENVQLLGGRRDDDQGGGGQRQERSAPRDERRDDRGGGGQQQPAGGQQSRPQNNEVNFDDIPFIILFALTSTSLISMMGA